MYRFQHHAQFFTATNLNWLHALQNEFHKQILLEALKHRVDKNEVTIYAFVIMPNHFHAIWQIHDGIPAVVGSSYNKKFCLLQTTKTFLFAH
jgi:putative transposase